jgi:hypothetical protein
MCDQTEDPLFEGLNKNSRKKLHGVRRLCEWANRSGAPGDYTSRFCSDSPLLLLARRERLPCFDLVVADIGEVMVAATATETITITKKRCCCPVYILVSSDSWFPGNGCLIRSEALRRHAKSHSTLDGCATLL